MLESKLLLIFAVCAAFILLNGLIAVRLRCGSGTALPVIVVPLTEKMESLEFLVRSVVYPAAEACPEAAVLAVDMGADSLTIRVFEMLMERSCRYNIVNSEECAENICKILNSMV